MIKRQMVKKIIASVVLAVFLLTVIYVPFAKAQVGGGDWYNPDYQAWSLKVFDSPPNEIFGERYTYAQVKWIFYSFAAILSGVSSEQMSCFMSNDIGACIQEVIADKSVTNLATKETSSVTETFFSQLSQVPVSGVYYFKNIGLKLGLVQEVQAQEPGFGFGALGPVLTLWQASRNITYAIFIIIIIASSFMIMFRVKISPQTVISIQSALPKIVIALVLVTFSYAIAGLLVDLTYVVIGIITAFLIQSGVFAQTTDWQALFSLFTEGPFGTGAFGLVLGYLALFPSVLIMSLAQALLSFSVAGALVGVLGILLFPIIILVVGIVLLWAGLKILWLLFKTFANIILLVILAPFPIALGAIAPGIGFGTWIRSLLSHLAVYPVVAVMFLLAFVFLNGAVFSILTNNNIDISIITNFIQIFTPIDINIDLLTGNLWSPPLTTGTKLYSLLWLGVSFVLVTMTPQAAELIKSIVSGQPFAYGTAIGQALRPMAGPAAYSMEGIYRGRLPGIYPRGIRDRFDQWMRPEAGKYGRLQRAVRGGAKTVARSLSEGRLPRKTS